MSDNKERNEAVAQMGDAIMVAVKGVTQIINSHHLIHLYNAGYHNGPKVTELSDEEVADAFCEGWLGLEEYLDNFIITRKVT